VAGSPVDSVVEPNCPGVSNSFGACQSTLITAPVPRYSLRDTTNGDSHKNLYGSDCAWGTGFGTATFNLVAHAGGSVQVPDGPRKTFAANDATPSVVGYKRWITNNTAATTIFNFDDAVPGQEIWVFVNDANTTFQNGGAILLENRRTKKGVNGQWYGFVSEGGFWYEVSGAQAFRAATNPFDAGSLNAGAKTAIATIEVSGATLGDYAEATFTNDLAGAQLRAWVSAANTVKYYFINENGSDPVTLGTGTVSVKVTPR